MKMYSDDQIRAARTLVAATENKINGIYGMDIRLIISGLDGPKKELELICEKVCMALGMEREAYKIKTRKREYCDMRFICILIINIFFVKATDEMISKVFDLDRTTVFHGREQGQSLIEAKDSDFIAKYEKAFKAVQQWIEEQ